jgi:hypothetical protein
VNVGASSKFAAKILDGLKATLFARVVVACGKNAEAATYALENAARNRDEGAVRVNLVEISQIDDFFRKLSSSIGCSQEAYDVEELITATSGYFQPRLVILLGLATETLMPLIIENARLVADVSRDLPAPIRFIWLHTALHTQIEPSISYEVWSAEWRDIPQIELSGGLDTVLNRAFDLYLDRRIYWEGAGQSDRISYLFDQVRERAKFSPYSSAVDKDLDQIFDSAQIPESDRCAISGCFSDQIHQDYLIKTLSQNLFPKLGEKVTQCWHAAGIVWRPPGISRWRITSMCMRILAEDTTHPITATLSQELVKTRMVHARANPQISQMTLVLATQIESELLDALRNETRWETLMEKCGLKDDIEKTRLRSQPYKEIFFKTDDSLLNYATFGQLVNLAQSASPAFKFPLSRELLWKIATVRNLAAHGHTVRWDGVRQVVEAVFKLSS